MSQPEEIKERPAPLSAAERKRLQRERDKSRGYIEITVRVPEDRIEEVRAHCAKLKPKKKVSRDKSQQLDIEDAIANRDMSLSAAG